MRWAQAVKIWNQHKKTVDPSHIYALPLKGTPEHAHAKFIQNGGNPEEFGKPAKKFEINKPKPKLAIKAPVNKEALEEIASKIKRSVAARRISKALEAHAAKKKDKMLTGKPFAYKKPAPEQAVKEDIKGALAKPENKEFLKGILMAFGGFSEEKAEKATDKMYVKREPYKKPEGPYVPRPTITPEERKKRKLELEKFTSQELKNIVLNGGMRPGAFTKRDHLMDYIITMNLPLNTKKNEELLEKEELRRRILAWTKKNGKTIKGIMSASKVEMEKLIKEHSIP